MVAWRVALHARTRLRRGARLPSNSVAVSLVPRQSLDESVPQPRRRLEAELSFGAGRVQAPPRLPVGLRRIPAKFAGKAAQIANHLGQLSDGGFLPGADVDRLRFVVTFGGQRDGLRCVAHEKELSRSGSGPPDVDVSVARVSRLDHL